jgi:nitrogen fixation/metabolism regulation signal transduction histidine kinase
MAGRLRIGGFEGRLLALFLVLSVVPTVLIAIFGIEYFGGYVDRLSNVAVRESFHNSMEIARYLSMRLDRDARNTTARIAGEFMDRRPGSVQIDKFLSEAVPRHSADFAALYALDGSTWKLVTSYPEDISRIDPEIALDAISPESGPQKVLYTDPDIVASAVRLGPGSVIVSGFLLDPGMTETMRKTGEDYSRYSSVGLYVNVLRRYSVLVVFALVAVMIASSAIASRLLASRISHPIRQLAGATERIAKGDLDHRVEVDAKDEIQSLVTSFNNMTRDLREYKNNLIRAERIAAWRDVARRIAHEIKNPLTPIEIGIYRLSKRLESTGENTEVTREILDSILKEVGVLRDLAQEFSSFAKMPEPKLEPTDINRTVRSVLELYTSSGEVAMETSLAGDLPPVLADEGQIRRVISNLVKNAVEAMGPGGRLRVRTSLADAGHLSGEAHLLPPAMVRVEVADSGPGIPEDIRDKIFDPYFTTKAKGTGLGLALAYRIIQDHGGTIAFDTGPGGTTFRVDLRVADEDTTGTEGKR